MSRQSTYKEGSHVNCVSFLSVISVKGACPSSFYFLSFTHAIQHPDDLSFIIFHSYW